MTPRRPSAVVPTAKRPAHPSPSHPLTLDPATCDDILADIRQPDRTLPDFGSIPSEPGTPPPALEREVPTVTGSPRCTPFCPEIKQRRPSLDPTSGRPPLRHPRRPPHPTSLHRFSSVPISQWPPLQPRGQPPAEPPHSLRQGGQRCDTRALP